MKAKSERVSHFFDCNIVQRTGDSVLRTEWQILPSAY